MRPSTHFSWAELTNTQVRDILNAPGPLEKANLVELATGWLEPLRAKFGPLYVTSAFRCPELNTRIGGSPNSAHQYGCAADLVPLRHGVTVTDMLLWIRDESGLIVDQVIDEKARGPTGWLHLSHKHPSYPTPRRQFLRMRGGQFTRIESAKGAPA